MHLLLSWHLKCRLILSKHDSVISEKMPHPSFVILRSLSLQFVKVFETVIFELNRRHDTDWMCEGLSNVVHDTVTLLCPQPVILLLIYWSGREEFLLLLVTFLAPSESGRQGGKSIQSGGSAIVDKNRIWKLRKICSIYIHDSPVWEMFNCW